MTNNIYKGATSVKVTERVKTCMYALRACNKAFKRAAMIALSGLLLAGCADEAINEGGGNGSAMPAGEPVYLTLNLTNKAGAETRSSTGSSDVTEELPRYFEAEVSSVMLLLVDPDDNNVILSAYDGSPSPVEGSEISYPAEDKGYKWQGYGSENASKYYTRYHSVFEISYDQAKDLSGQDVLVYLVCNPTDSVQANAGGNIQQVLYAASVDAVKELGSKPMDRDGTTITNYQFLMTNGDFTSEEGLTVNPYKITISPLITSGSFNKVDNPYPLTDIPTTAEDAAAISALDCKVYPVQRALARFDVLTIEDEDNPDQNTMFWFTRDGQPMDQANSEGCDWLTFSYLGLINESRYLNLFKETGNNKTKTTQGTDWDYFWPEYNATTSSTRFVFDPKMATKESTDFLQTRTFADTNAYYLNHLLQTNLFSDPENYDRLNEENKYVRGKIFTPYNLDGSGNYQKDIMLSADGEYHIRRYCTPNTLLDRTMQKNGNTTAMAFVAQVNFHGGLGDGTLDESQAKNDEQKEAKLPGYHECPVYQWNSVFFGVNSDLIQAAKDKDTSQKRAMADALSDAIDAYNREMGSGFNLTTAKDDDFTSIDKEDFVKYRKDYGDYDFRKIEDNDLRKSYEKYLDYLWYTARDSVIKKNGGTSKAAMDARYERYRMLPSPTLARHLVDNGFAIYIPTDPQGNGSYEYMCYYLYWNRHNDNNNNGVMGDMEFSVVRNNIYKLKITGVKTFGHPIPRYDYPDYPVDPDPIDPWTDDETTKDYFSVECQVRPWNVVVNDNIGLGR